MKTFKNLIACMAATLALGAAVTGCQDDFDNPRTDAPVATLQANTTIAEFKKEFWQDKANYADTVTARADGTHYIIKGRVVSSDEDGNIFKNIVIQDETDCITLSINSYNLYLNYRRGQEVVIDATGMYVGKYAGLMQFGLPSYYANGETWQVGFMPPELFKMHTQLNGWPDVAAIDTTVVDGFQDFATTPEGLQYWQSRLVRINNVHFDTSGKPNFSVYHSNANDDVNRTLYDQYGNNIVVRTSGYANFAETPLPQGNGDIVGILGFYENLAGATTWQLALIDIDGCQNFGNPTQSPGTQNNPYTVAQAIALETAGKSGNGWVQGYIVGSVAPEVTAVTSNDDIIWGAQAIIDNTLVIADAADVKDYTKVVVVPLKVGSKLQTLGNLADHPENLGKLMNVRGNLEKTLDTWGVTGNPGTTDSWTIEGVDTGDKPVTPGNGTEDQPYTCAQIIGLNPQSSSATDYPGVWAAGYIVGWADMSSTFYINAETSRFSVPATMATNILVADQADCTDFSKCIGIQLPSGSVRSALNLVDNPGNLGKFVKIKGDVMKYSGVSGIKNTNAYVLDGGGNTPGPGPSVVVTSINENFDASTALPAGWTQMQVQGTKTWYIATFNNNNYAAMTGYKGTAPFDSWLVTPGIDIAKCDGKTLSFDTQFAPYGATTTTFEVYVLDNADPTKATLKEKLNPALPTSAASTYSDWVASGTLDLSKYSGTIYIGFCYKATQDANYATWCVDNVKVNAGGDTPTPPTPPTPSDEFKGDFNSFNGGEPKASPYGEYTNATGWVATNSIILGGGDTDANPRFTFIGAAGTLAPTLNGKKGAEGTLTSPAITGGIGTLTFKYGFAFSDTKCAFRVDVLDAAGGAVVKTDTVTLDTLTKQTAYDYSLAVNYSGTFKIVITNLGLSASTSNKDRVSIWNLTWTE